MKKIEIYDPAMCCSTGVCGTDVDTKLVQFANDLSWLKEKKGVAVQRFNLGQEPAAFAQNAEVRTLLTKDGNGCLPIVLVDGSVATKGIYPTRDQLAHLADVEEESSCCGGDDEPSSATKESDCCSDKSTGSSCC